MSTKPVSEMKAFADKYNVQFAATLVQTEPCGRKHYAVIINGQRFDYNQGSGIKHKPRAEDVLYCIQSDIRTLNEGSFKNWAESLGYDQDSISALKTYLEIQSENDRMVKALKTREAFNEFESCEE